ncbi:anaerobic ribonucleoside-triphosphate reductase activating protein [Anaeromicropila populeti]|uniref:Pyruvate formate lyase activating enzyme n=1 Tax=Anaeromicropila populeti TaxID=37658 RepID=A0A1I6LH16_9FIRM|nr:anaerobic ribonucleoside-triphosphate reductase activating protein [Anaeromicropila populeti]SFS02704.1 pyruvate formate lyase activating enzyme [Anaeromicropila populeti]
MLIDGIQKVTLLDYPGHIAATLFLANCNFRCPFCHNRDLVLTPEHQNAITLDEVISFLKTRIHILEGVCITGGEPTLNPELSFLLEEIKSLGFLVKLDTNGSNPDILQHLLERNLLDYIAMDIKNAKENYFKTIGKLNFSLQNIEDSVTIIMNSEISYEFRTTIVKELHTQHDIEEISHWLAGAEAYYLQNFQPSEQVIYPFLHAHTKDTLEQFCQVARKEIEHVEIRGI